MVADINDGLLGTQCIRCHLGGISLCNTVAVGMLVMLLTLCKESHNRYNLLYPSLGLGHLAGRILKGISCLKVCHETTLLCFEEDDNVVPYFHRNIYFFNVLKASYGAIFVYITKYVF